MIGLGYVGLPLALLAESKGFEVIGIDLDKKKIDSLNAHKSTINEPRINKQIINTKIHFTNKIEGINSLDAVIICVPTPVDDNKTPDLTPVTNAVRSLTPHMRNGSLLVIESTINPGVCDEVIIPLIETETSHQVGKTLHIAHCPERINPGDPKWNVSNINRVLGSNSEVGLNLAYDFYNKLVDANIMKMGTIKEAEAVKVVENSFRDINIAFVNELAMSFDKLGINVNNVIDGAATKPFAFMAHYPGIGVGGHCIPVDPYYLIEYARSKGFKHQFLSLARNINESMPVYAIDRLEEAYILKTGKTLRNASVAVLGLSYKPNVADDRESPAYKIIDELELKKAKIVKFDPFYTSKSDTLSAQEALRKCDSAILVTGHNEFKNLNIADFTNIKVLLDGRNIYSERTKEFNTVNTVYVGLGT